MIYHSQKFPYRLLTLVLLLFLLAGGIFAQEETRSVSRINYNSVYRFPFSFGFEYQVLSPMSLLGTDYKGDFSISDFSLLGMLPIQGLPVLHPLMRFGLTLAKPNYTVENSTLEKFDHFSLYLTLGLGLHFKLSKQIEAGAELELGTSYSVFPSLDPSTEKSYGAWNIQGSFGGRLSFNPSYSISIGFHPNIRYQYSFSPLERFNGFAFSLGFSMSYRFGTDPDAPQAKSNSIRFGGARVDNLFASMQSYYVINSIGSVSITNMEKYSLTDVTVSFVQEGFMDVPTIVKVIPELKGGETQEVSLLGTYNKNIFSIVGVTPLTGEILVDFNIRTRSAAQSTSVKYDLYDKNSIVWDDDRKVAAYITPKDSALGNYVGQLRQWTRDAESRGYNNAVQTAMQIYIGLTELGTIYQLDPIFSFENVQGNTGLIDTVSLPRETLIKKAGDCDDLTVLYNSLLESAGIATGFITTPGHLYTIFATGVAAKDYRLIHPDKYMTININGELWVPVEITYIGSDNFLTAWREGAEEFGRYVDIEDKFGLNLTRKAQEVYRPIGFEESDLGLQYGDSSKIFGDFLTELSQVKKLVLDGYALLARESGNKGSWNTYGVVSAQLEDYDRASQALNTALTLDRTYVFSKVNLANVYFLQEEYQNALRLYHEAERQLQEEEKTGSGTFARLLLSIAKTYHEIEYYDLSSNYAEELAKVNPDLASRHPYLLGRKDTEEIVPESLFIQE